MSPRNLAPRLAGRGAAVFFGLFMMVVASGCQTTALQKHPVFMVVVKPGDTLAGIAARYGTDWYAIAKDNDLLEGSQLKPGALQTGDVLSVRPGDMIAVETPKKRGLLFGGDDDDSDNDQKLAGTMLPWPVHGRLSSPFGHRWGRLHAGIDISAPRGTPIQAPAPGLVIFAGRKHGYGRTVILQHQGFKTLYGHCHKVLVHQGQQIEEGQVIGMVGASGNAEGTHLHFEYRTMSDTPVDPLLHLQAPPSTLARAGR